jgi:hypothetical protein
MLFHCDPPVPHSSGEDGRIFIATCCNSRLRRLLLSRDDLKRTGSFRLPLRKRVAAAYLFRPFVSLVLPTVNKAWSPQAISCPVLDPALFSWQLVDSYIRWQLGGFSDLFLSALLRLFPCASIRVVRRSDQGYFAGPSLPPHGDPGAVATFSSLSSNLPGAGPRPNSAGRTSPRRPLCGRQSQEAL